MISHPLGQILPVVLCAVCLPTLLSLLNFPQMQFCNLFLEYKSSLVEPLQGPKILGRCNLPRFCADAKIKGITCLNPLDTSNLHVDHQSQGCIWFNISRRNRWIGNIPVVDPVVLIACIVPLKPQLSRCTTHPQIQSVSLLNCFFQLGEQDSHQGHDLITSRAWRSL